MGDNSDQPLALREFQQCFHGQLQEMLIQIVKAFVNKENIQLNAVYYSIMTSDKPSARHKAALKVSPPERVETGLILPV